MAFTSAQLQALYTSVHFGLTPNASAQAVLDALLAANASGSLTDAQIRTAVIDTADADSAVAIGSYQFFTGKSPTQAGISYLVNSTSNANDLNDPYYAQFNQTNRYINFAQNLGMLGEGQLLFQALYGSMSFGQAVATAYESIVGSSQATAAGINPTAAIADIASRLPYFTAVAAERFPTLNQDLAIKSALVGYIMSEAMKANVGKFAAATANMLTAVAAGTATYNTDILVSYAASGGSTGGSTGGSGGSGGSGGFSTTAPAAATNVSVDLTAGTNANQTNLGPNPGSTVTVGHASNALTMSLANATGTTDVVNLTLASTTAAGVTVKLTSANVETLNVTSAGTLSGGGATNILNLDDAVSVFSRINVFGSAPVAVNLGDYDVSVILNGGGATGEQILNAGAVTTATVGASINGGSANDTITPVSLAGASSMTQLLYGGGGGDIFNLGASHSQRDVILYKAGSESTYDVTNAAGASGTSTANTGKMDVINNFKTGQDKIDLTVLGFTATQGLMGDKGTVASNAAMATLAATADFYKDGGGILRAIAQVHVGADTFLYVDTDKNGVYGASDLVVKFAGVAVLDPTDILR